MISSSYTYQSIWRDAQKVTWRVEDLIGGDKHLDFTKPFLPEALVGVADIPYLNDAEKRVLNQIRGRSYVHLFILVEKSIIPMVLEQVRRIGLEDIYTTQALLGFAEEESKHIHLFQQFAQEFEQGFGLPCTCVEPTEAIAKTILKHHPLSVLLFMLQFEWMTQSHYLEMVRDNDTENLDPQFCSLLKHHWLEEAQHTKLDTLLIYELVEQLADREMEAAIADYLAIAQLLDQTLMQQVKLDLESLESAIGRRLTKLEYQEILTVQELSYRWTFMCAGMTHPNFVNVLNQISPSGKERVIALAKALS